MFQNFNMVDFIILGSSVLLNIVLLVTIIILVLKNKKMVLDITENEEEIKVTKLNNNDNTAFDEIIEAMQKDLDSKVDDAVEIFEQEQEEKAIISYQELLNAKNKNEENFEKLEKLEIPVQESMQFEEEIEIPLEKPKATPVLATTEKKFTNSEFVSPVFGKMDRNVSLRVEPEEYDNFDLEKTLNIEPLTEEIKKNNEFLNALKEFRKNL